MKPDQPPTISRQNLIGIGLATISFFLLIFIFEPGGYIDCNLEDTPKIEVSGDLYFYKINHHKSADYIVKIKNPSKPINGSISCRKTGTCGILMETKRWPQPARLTLNQCKPISKSRLFIISEIEISGAKQSFDESTAFQKETFFWAMAIAITSGFCAIFCFVLFAIRIKK